ncbi:MAG: hypothetical protein ACC651_01810 [Candidatus Scalindua sp.]
MTELEFVIRTVGERTEDVCVELVNLQKDEHESLHLLRENTHAKAVESTIAIGLESRAEWLVAIDADMLLTPGSILSIRKEIRSCSDAIVVLHPAVVDKLYRMRRWGLTVYRKAALEELNIKFQDIKKKQNIKIESAAIKALGENKQRQVYFSREVAAIHDFYQYYKDLYRKAYLNVSRNQGFNKDVKKCWKRLANSDPDYLVMYKAMEDATVESRNLTNSISDFKSSELDSIVSGLGLKEKPPLLWDDYVDQCHSVSMEEEIQLIDKDRVFNDFFDNISLTQKLKTFFRG